jgi:hypothetical protein
MMFIVFFTDFIDLIYEGRLYYLIFNLIFQKLIYAKS